MNLVSILLGILPESVFFALFIIFAKQLKKRRITLFLMIFTLNIMSGWFFAYSVYYHLCFTVGTYLILYRLYGSHIIDMFLITGASFLLIVLSSACLFVLTPIITIMLGNFNFYGLDNYYVGLVINRALLFVTLFIIHDKISYCYTVYRKFWNKVEGAKIKSITVRNISCVVLNVSIYVIYIFIIYGYKK